LSAANEPARAARRGGAVRVPNGAARGTNGAAHGANGVARGGRGGNPRRNAIGGTGNNVGRTRASARGLLGPAGMTAARATRQPRAACSPRCALSGLRAARRDPTPHEAPAGV